MRWVDLLLHVNIERRGRLTIAKSWRQASPERALDAAEILATSHQVVTRAVERTEGRASDVVTHAVNDQTVSGVQQVSRKRLVSKQSDLTNGGV